MRFSEYDDFDLHEPAYNHFVSWAGPVGKDLDRRLRTLKFRAVSSAPMDTGALKASITVKRWVGVEELNAKVGSPLPYAYYVHEGTGVWGARHRPYTVKPKGKKALRFFNSETGTMGFAANADLMGMRGTNYLTHWLKEFVR